MRGRVEFSDGRPAPNALVAGGLAIVRTDANGNFVLDGVPTGQRYISAGLERNEATGIKFPRLGSARLDVVPGDSNFTVIRFAPPLIIKKEDIDFILEQVREVLMPTA